MDILKGARIEVEFENREGKRVEFGDRAGIGGGGTKVGGSLVAGHGVRLKIAGGEKRLGVGMGMGSTTDCKGTSWRCPWRQADTSWRWGHRGGWGGAQCEAWGRSGRGVEWAL